MRRRMENVTDPMTCQSRPTSKTSCSSCRRIVLSLSEPPPISRITIGLRQLYPAVSRRPFFLARRHRYRRKLSSVMITVSSLPFMLSFHQRPPAPPRELCRPSWPNPFGADSLRRNRTDIVSLGRTWRTREKNETISKSNQR